MDSVEQFVGTLVKVAPIAAGFLAYMSTAPNYLGLDASIVVIVGIIAAIHGLGLYFFAKDVDEKFEELSVGLEVLRVETAVGFERTLTAIRESGDPSDTLRTDGGTAAGATSEAPKPQTDGGTRTTNDARFHHIEVEEPSGVGALGGVVAGGIAGAPFGPAGVLVGGVVGGIAGNAVEFRNLKERQRRKIEAAARRFVRARASPPPRTSDLVEVTEGRGDRGEYWTFEFVDGCDDRHVVVFHLDDGRFVYRGRERS